MSVIATGGLYFQATYENIYVKAVKLKFIQYLATILVTSNIPETAIYCVGKTVNSNLKV